MKSSNLGYPRIGDDREWKKALEELWAGKITQEDFLQETRQLRLAHLQKQKEKGLDLIPVNDSSYYDHMLDTAVMFGLVPKRFEYEGGAVPLSTYFEMARGSEQAVASEMTKWFNTNYHYIVPEFGERTPELVENKPLQAFLEAKEQLGILAKPVLIGPYTFVKLSKGYEANAFQDVILQILPLYEAVLKEMELHGVEWVQIDEPSFVTEESAQHIQLIEAIYARMHTAAPHLKIMLQTYFEAVDWYEQLVQLPVEGIGLDLVHGLGTNLENVQKFGFPMDKVLGAGLVDGRNIWRASLEAKGELLYTLTQHVSHDRVWVQPSCSLLHVPVSLNQETDLTEEVRNALAFADEKLDEITLLVTGYQIGKYAISKEIAKSEAALELLARSSVRNRREVADQLAAIFSQPIGRIDAFSDRLAVQNEKWQLPPLPTTTIGSFPQTAEVRQSRQKYKRGEWSAEQYDTFIQLQIQKWMDIQEELGLDVLVHGEFERTDMVEFFAEKLRGFTFTKNGWVQSYGSRCVKPPLIYGDVEFLQPMTVKESKYAQSLTAKPVKGMLTGPATMLNWSFVRDDISRKQVCQQIALALRQEVKALEHADIRMIQVDEPALREGLPLKTKDQKKYLGWAVEAFRLATSSVQATTQIYTHMCYCEFHDFIDVISELDADVISIESSRSHGELVTVFETCTYDKGIGLGVYDIHSPRVPSVDELEEIVLRGLQVLAPGQLWINPDCGLKTRGIEETVQSLRHMVAATQRVRERLTTLYR